MRFGITPINMENIANMFNKEKGIKSFLDFRFSDVALQAAERGYKHCEITLDIFQILPIPFDDEEIQKLKKIKKDYGMTYSAHFPFMSLELCSPNKYIRDASAQAVIDSYALVKPLLDDIEVFVLHPTGSLGAGITKAEIEPKYFDILVNLLTGFSIKAIKKIVKETKIDTTKIAIENIEFPFEATLEMIKKIKGSKLLIDTAHFLGGYSGKIHSTGEALVEVAEKYLDITSEIHLQDFSAGMGADHAALGTGIGFPPKFLKVIHEYGFEGPVVFELTHEQAKESLEFIKKNAPEIKLPDIK